MSFKKGRWFSKMWVVKVFGRLWCDFRVGKKLFSLMVKSNCGTLVIWWNTLDKLYKSIYQSIMDWKRQFIHYAHLQPVSSQKNWGEISREPIPQFSSFLRSNPVSQKKFFEKNFQHEFKSYNHRKDFKYIFGSSSWLTNKY